MTVARPRPPARPAPPTITSHPAAPSAGSETIRVASPTPAAMPRRRPAPSNVLPKGEEHAPQREEINHAIQGETRAEPEASVIVVPAGSGADEGEYRRAYSYAEAEEHQITMLMLHNMNLAEKHALWKRLNAGLDNMFISILRRDSYPRNATKTDPPATGKPLYKKVMWCCYCADWTVFEHFSYVGSDKCIGCSISTKDFYNRGANNLWKSDM